MNKLITLLDRRIVLRQSVADILLGALVILLNLFLILVGTQLYISEGYGNSYGITPRTFPRLVFGVAVLLGAILVVRGVIAARRRDGQEKTVSFYLMSAAIFLNIIIFVVIMKPIGYPLANIIMVYVMYWLSGGKSWWKGLVLALAFTIVSVLFFYVYLKLSIPLGVVELLLY